MIEQKLGCVGEGASVKIIVFLGMEKESVVVEKDNGRRNDRQEGMRSREQVEELDNRVVNLIRRTWAKDEEVEEGEGGRRSIKNSRADAQSG